MRNFTQEIKCGVLILLAGAGISPAQPQASQSSINERPVRDTYLKFASEVDIALQNDVLKVWFPRTVDKDHGGFHSHFARDWRELPSDGKFSVFQGRMT